MSNKPAPWNLGRIVMNIGFFRGFFQQMRLSWKLFKDPRVPVLTKAIPVVTILYLISPVDWLINAIPIIGQMEDIAVLGLGMNLFIQAAPQEVVNEYQRELQGNG